ncbi:MAG: hypothetical protein RLZZ627_896 [Pseudomonadota bacterium]|jgi:hypothetical protein
MSSRVISVKRSWGSRGNPSDRTYYALWIGCFVAALTYEVVSLAQAETVPVETPKKPEVARTELPNIRKERPKRVLSPEESRVEVQLPETGIKVLKGKIRGYQATVFALRVRQGQRLKVNFESQSSSAFFNVVDEADSSGTALFVGQSTTSRSIIIPVLSDGTYLLQPYLVRSVARRGRQVNYVLTIDLHSSAGTSEVASPH